MGSEMRIVNRSKLLALVKGKVDLDESDFRKLMLILITIVVAAIAVNLAWGIGNYILVTVNNSVSGAIHPLIPSSNVAMSGTVYTLYIIIAVVSAVGAMIAVFMKLGQAGGGATTT